MTDNVIKFRGYKLSEKPRLKSDINLYMKETDMNDKEISEALRIPLPAVLDLKAELEKDTAALEYRQLHGVNEYLMDECAGCGEAVDKVTTYKHVVVPFNNYEKHIVLCADCVGVSSRHGVNI